MESIIAVMLTTIAVVGLMSMQPMAWQAAGKADTLSHATEILQAELEAVEIKIMSGTSVSSDSSYVNQTIGNETFQKKTTITASGTSGWLVHVHVKWSSNANGVKSSMLVTRQTGF